MIYVEVVRWEVDGFFGVGEVCGFYWGDIGVVGWEGWFKEGCIVCVMDVMCVWIWVFWCKDDWDIMFFELYEYVVDFDGVVMGNWLFFFVVWDWDDFGYFVVGLVEEVGELFEIRFVGVWGFGLGFGGD